eukprot:CAMPEP_0179340312 /NCGR_PEP_ID=MMETSP0797-20121207/69218_1 /TAXON_ID=47934 /ORGANISM="Dinophysis acuminata, Strain DAEP01" /LENGTH=183 /DNA_ID=CAMNT_0021054275 /DNA_START=39 /DNA_END=589 /DNA_ORIENTATION=+
MASQGRHRGNVAHAAGPRPGVVLHVVQACARIVSQVAPLGLQVVQSAVKAMAHRLLVAVVLVVDVVDHGGDQADEDDDDDQPQDVPWLNSTRVIARTSLSLATSRCSAKRSAFLTTAHVPSAVASPATSPRWATASPVVLACSKCGPAVSAVAAGNAETGATNARLPWGIAGAGHQAGRHRRG